MLRTLLIILVVILIVAALAGFLRGRGTRV
jgi:hypothetical protein